MFKRRNKIICSKCGKKVPEDWDYCYCGNPISDRGIVQIQFKPTEEKDQRVKISVNGKELWTGEIREYAQLRFKEPTVLWIKYSSAFGGLVGGGICEAIIDPEKSKKWVVAPVPGKYPELSLKPVDEFTFD